MRIPVIRGAIERRILVNYRVDPEVLLRLLPQPFRPALVHGWGMAGICLIRLAHIRPRWLPAWAGIASENAAHRIAVEWDDLGERRVGVFIPRRDTSNGLNVFAGGWLFPGVHNHARFDVAEGNNSYRVHMQSDDRQASLLVAGTKTGQLPESSIFESLPEASDFFARGSLGYSPTRQSGLFDGLELRTQQWHVEPLAIERVQSSFFDDRQRFPRGSTALDCALLMRDLEHEWHGHGSLSCVASISSSPRAESSAPWTVER